MIFEYVRRYKTWKKTQNKFLMEIFEIIFFVIPVVFFIKTVFFGLYQVPTCSMEHTMLAGERFFADKLTPFFRAPKRGAIIAFNPPTYDYSDNPFVNTFERYASWNITSFTKRVIGLPGEHVQGKIEDGKPVIYIDGKKLDEPYVNQYPIKEVYKDWLPEQGNKPGLARRTYVPEFSMENQPFYRFSHIDLVRAKREIERINASIEMYNKQYGTNFQGMKEVYQPYTPVIGQDGKNMDEYDITLGPDEYWVLGDNRQGSSDSRFFGALPGQMIHAYVVFRIWSIDTDYGWWIFDLLQHPIDFWKRIRWSRCLNVLH